MKEQSKTLGKDLNETEMSDLPDKRVQNNSLKDAY